MIVYLVSGSDASTKQISLFSGFVLIFLAIYLFVLDIYKQLKNNENSEELN